MAAKTNIKMAKIQMLSRACLDNLERAISEGKKSLIHYDLLINIDYEKKSVEVSSNDEKIEFSISAYDRRLIFKMFK